MFLHSAKLDWVTQNAEQTIARHARVSTKDPDREEFAGLLSYCIKHSHWSVFEQAAASFEIFTTRAISPQILRHRSFCFQEFSQRYSNPLDTFDSSEVPAYLFGLRKQAEKNRQSSVDVLDPEVQNALWERVQGIDTQIRELYEDMIASGVARECARNLLPLYTPTRLHMQGSIRSFLFYVGLRGQQDTQLEHRLIAREIGRLLEKELPIIVAAVKETDLESLKGWTTLL